jgi:carbamoyl-phosphate synthase large subunit
MAHEPINVLVTAIGGGGHGEQILKALRMAGGERYRLFGGDMNPRCPQFALVAQGMTLPAARDPGFVDAVLDVCARFNIQALFHGCEPELLAYSQARELFAARGVLLPINKSDVIDLCMDKSRSSEFLQKAGFAPPRFVLAESNEQASQLNCFPLVVKPHIGSGGSKDCFVVQNPRELQAIITFLDASPDNRIMVQEYVGTPEEEYTVGVLHDLDGGYINSIAVRRELKGALNLRISTPNRTKRSELGPRLVVSSGISMGEVCKPPEVLNTCEKIAKALDVRGAVNIQGRMTADGFKVFEINPRFSGTTSIRAMMGYNEPDVLLRKHLLGERITPGFSYEQGYVLRSLVETRV